MNVIKILANGRVISAIVSAIGAIISACCAGCKLYCGELTVKDFDCAFWDVNHSITNVLNEVK